MGRPSLYSQEMCARICSELSEGRSLVTICLPADMPARSTVFLWLAANKDFSDMYARAREAAADWFAEELVAIADTATNKDDAPAIKVRIDARIWVASKLRPKVYGNHQAVALTGNEGGPIQVIIQGDDANL